MIILLLFRQLESSTTLFGFVLFNVNCTIVEQSVVRSVDESYTNVINKSIKLLTVSLKV